MDNAHGTVNLDLGLFFCSLVLTREKRREHKGLCL